MSNVLYHIMYISPLNIIQGVPLCEKRNGLKSFSYILQPHGKTGERANSFWQFFGKRMAFHYAKCRDANYCGTGTFLGKKLHCFVLCALFFLGKSNFFFSDFLIVRQK